MKRTIMSDPNPYSTSNGSSNKRSKPPAPPHVSFRLLCHASRIGGVIGKSGSIIKQLQQSTGAKIRIEEAPNECPDRVVTVTAPTTINTTMTVCDNNKSRISGGIVNISGNGNGSVGEDNLYSNEGKFHVSKAQEGLIRVFERILEVASESHGVEMDVVSCRLLAETSQVGSVIGKGGKVVERIRKESGCKVRVLTENLSACAGPNDEIVEIEGDVLAVKKGLLAVSRCLQDCPSVDKTRNRPHEAIPQEVMHRTLEAVPQESMRRTLEPDPQETMRRHHEVMPRETIRRPHQFVPQETLWRPIEAVPQESLRRPFEVVPQDSILPDLRVDFLPQRNTALPTTPSRSVSYATGVHPFSLELDRVPTMGTKMQQQEVSFRILCSNNRIGGVIGKGGTIVKNLQSETGASITIGATVAECDERLITVTASENPESRYSSAQRAIVLVFSRLVETSIGKGQDLSSSKGLSITARLVVASNQVGCLLGKGGTIISEMRKVTGTGIWILGDDQVPKCASENSKVVQISGEFLKVKDAIYNITGRLRDNLFSSTPNIAGTSTSLLTETNPYERLRDPTPHATHSSVSASHGLNRHTPITQGMDHLGLSHTLDRPPSPRTWTSHTLDRPPSPRTWTSHTLDRPPSPGTWASQPQAVTGVHSRAITDVGRSYTHKGGLELGSGNKTAIVTNTTVEIRVPENVIGSVYGENGSNLVRLRQISGAKVIVHEPRLGSSDRIVVISGSPDETQAAQSLLQAFIISGA